MDTIETSDSFPRTHNQPPLEEVLAEETVELRSRATQLVESAGRAAVTDDDSAQRAAILVAMIKEFLADTDKTREERKRPFLEAGRAVDAHFSAIAGDLVTYDQRRRPVGGPLFNVLSQVDGYRRKKEAEAEAERRRLEEEARKQREAAEAAARAQREAEERERRAREEADRRVREAEAAAKNAKDDAARETARREAAEAQAARGREEAAARQRQMDAELEQRSHEEEAARLERQAAETIAAPITTAVGVKAHRRAVFRVEIDNLRTAVQHCLKVDPGSLQACVQQIYDRQVKAGVRSLPGAQVIEDSATTIRR